MEAVAAFTRQLFHRAAVAFMGAEGDGPLALHAALETILTDAANAPELTSMSVIELPRLGPPAHERHARMIALFGELLAPGFATMERPPPNPETLALCLGGSVWETLRRHAAEGRCHDLPDALPGLSFVCVSAIFGSQEARRVLAPSPRTGPSTRGTSPHTAVDLPVEPTTRRPAASADRLHSESRAPAGARVPRRHTSDR